MKSIEDRRAALRAKYATWTPRTLDACAEHYGDRPFVLTDEVTYTYAEVAERSRRLADGLVALGVGPGERGGPMYDQLIEKDRVDGSLHAADSRPRGRRRARP
jgi:acyl-CoA synthetase (AMP-forming)/AMP-acid ligase II